MFDWYNVKENAGSISGNYVSDWVDNVNLHITATTGPKTIYFPKGVYVLHFEKALLLVEPGVTLVGDGAESIIRKMGGDTTKTYLPNIQIHAPDATVRRLYMDTVFGGNGTERGLIETAAIDAKHIRFEELELFSGHAGIWLKDGADMTIDRCFVHGSEHPVYIGENKTGGVPITDVRITNNHIDGWNHLNNKRQGQDGIKTLTRCSNLLIDGNKIHRHYNDGIDLFTSGDRVSVTNNWIEDNLTTGLDIKEDDFTYDPSVWGKCKDLLIQGNHISVSPIGIKVWSHDRVLQAEHQGDIKFIGLRHPAGGYKTGAIQTDGAGNRVLFVDDVSAGGSTITTQFDYIAGKESQLRLIVTLGAASGRYTFSVDSLSRKKLTSLQLVSGVDVMQSNAPGTTVSLQLLYAPPSPDEREFGISILGNTIHSFVFSGISCVAPYVSIVGNHIHTDKLYIVNNQTQNNYGIYCRGQVTDGWRVKNALIAHNTIEDHKAYAAGERAMSGVYVGYSEAISIMGNQIGAKATGAATIGVNLNDVKEGQLLGNHINGQVKQAMALTQTYAEAQGNTRILNGTFAFCDASSSPPDYPWLPQAERKSGQLVFYKDAINKHMIFSDGAEWKAV